MILTLIRHGWSEICTTSSMTPVGSWYKGSKAQSCGPCGMVIPTETQKLEMSDSVKYHYVGTLQ